MCSVYGFTLKRDDCEGRGLKDATHIYTLCINLLRMRPRDLIGLHLYTIIMDKYIKRVIFWILGRRINDDNNNY